MTSTNDGNEVNSNQRSGHRNKSYYIELYKSLEARLNGEGSLEARTTHVCEAWRRVYSLYQHSAPSTHPHLFSWLQRHTASTVLQSKWAESKSEHARLTAALESLVAEVEAAAAGRDHHPWEQLLLQRANWFRKALENPWGHPVLKSLINPNGEPVTDQQVLEWLVEERGIVLVTRLRQLVSAGNCDDLALLLASAVMDRARAATPRRLDDANDDKTEQPVDTTSFVAVLERDASFTADVWELLTDIELVLLLKTDKRPRCIELAKLTPLRHGYAMVERLRNRLETSPRDKKLWKHAKEVATLVTQVIIARCMVLQKCAGVGRAALYCCARSLARLVPPARLPAVSNTLAAAAATARHLHTFCTALDAQCSADMKPFICELYVRAITAGMNELEQLKLNAEKPLEARSCEQMLASWFTQLGALLAASARLRAECALTAFSVHPASNFYERVADMPQPPPLKTAQEPAPETTSEFGSWANDSRTQSNLVKTSETLQMKQTEQHQANVLSTAVLTEGETLGLEPELCQDLSVLLSGPRVKTLSWDMDREVLLQNCRSYMERTHGGTRAVTTELKYLNLDPSAYVHLPEEDDEETGIERGYEHELQLENPEEIWEEAFFDGEITESAEDSEVEIHLGKLRKIQLAKTKKDKKSKAPAASSDDEEDPLSCLVDAKKEKKKLAKEKSKEQRRKKTHKRDTSKDDGRDRRKVKDKKPKKESKKDKSEQPMTGSLTSLLGMKISNMPSPVQDGEKRVRKKKERRRNTDALFSYVSVTDSDYDSQEKSSQKSDDPNIVVDGVFSMDELKSPERQSDSQIDNMKPSLKTYGIAQSTVINDIKSRPKVNSPKVSTNSDDSDVSRSKSPYLTPNQLVNRHVVSSKVKSSISKLLQFRRNKSHHRPVPSKSPAPSNLPPAAPQTLVGMKIYNADEIPKVYTNKKQTPDVNNMSNLLSEKMVNNKPHVPYNETAKADNKLQNLYNVQKHSQDNNTMLGMSPNLPNVSPKVHVEYLHSSPTKVIQHSNFMINESPSHAHRNYASPVKSVDHMSPQALNLSPPKQTIVHQPFHRSLQNLSTDNMKYDTPKKPVLINDPNYQQAKSSTSELSPRILSNTCIKAPNQTLTSSQCAKDNVTLSHSNLISRGSVQNVSQVTNLKSDVIRYGSKQLSSSMQDVNDITKKHIPSNNDMRRGTTSYTLPYRIKSQSDLSNTSQTFLVGENTSVSRCTPIQNHVKSHQNVLPTQHTSGSELKSNYQEFFDNLAKSINAGSIDPGKSINLNKHVKVTPVQVPSTPAITKRINSTQCAKQLIQQKKTETAPNTFSRRNYNKNKQNETKLLNDSLSLELNKNIIDHKLIKAKCLRNNVVISRVPIPNKQEQGNMVNDIGESSTKLQKACPVLSSMLDSPRKCIEKDPTHTNTTTTGQTVSDNQTDREHADLLLLLRQQPVVKPVLNTIGTSTSDAILKHNLSSSQTLIGTKVKNIGTVLDNKPPVASAGVKQESTVKENMPQDWERVMDALLAHKTEPLGPNALDMVLKKDYKRHSQSSSRSQTSHKPRTSIQSSSQIKPDSKQREYSSKPSSATRKPSTEKHSEIPKRRRPSGGTIKKPSSTEVLKKIEDQSKYVITNSSKDDDPFISGIPNSAYDMLGDLLDDDLRRELGELSSDEDAYNTPNMAMVKEKSSNIPKTGAIECKMSKSTKEISHIVNPQKILRKVETKQSTVDSDSTTAYPNVKIDNARQQDATTIEIPHIVNPQNILRKIETKSNTVNACSTTAYPNVIVNNSSQQDAATMSEPRPTVVCTSIEQHTATVITNPIESNMANHTIVGPHHFITNIDPTNVIIASVPVPAQPVVVIRQDLVYDPYPAIRIHESQVSAGLCNLNQNMYAINTTPNIAVYQTTQFAAPVVNPVIIGNAMTSTDAKDPVGDQQCAPDPMKDNEKPPNKGDIDSAIANRLTEDNNEMPDKSKNLDFNMNKNCERKVLSQVQENHLTENSDIESHKRNLSDDYALKTEQHAERIKLKRQSLLNRKINHTCYHPPIPLTYTPLSEKINLGKILHKETPKNGTIASDLLSIPNSTDTIEKPVSIDSTSVDSPNPEINNENIESSKQASAKENQKSCRRIWLRSSNKLDDKMSPVKRNRIPLRRNKFKLKVTKRGIEKTTHVQNKNEEEVNNAPRISRRLMDKNKLKLDTSVSSSNQQHNELVNNEKDKTINRTQLQQNDLENLIDFEEELWGSKILKTSTATVESEETSNHATHSNDVTDDEENYNTDDEQVANCDTVGDMQSNLDGIKETEVAQESNQLTYDDVKPDVVIGSLQNKLGDQLVIKSLTVNASELPGDSNITDKNHELKILAEKVEEKQSDITITKPKDCKDTTKCMKVTPQLEVQNKPQTPTSNAESLKTNEKFSQKVIPKAATVMVQRKSNRHIKFISTKVASVLKPLDTKHTPMMQKDCPMRNLPETKDTQPSDKVIAKTNSIGSATNKTPQTRTTGNKSLLCNESINDLPKRDCASNTNAVIVNRDKRAPIICRPTNVCQQTTIPVLIDKSKNVNNAPAVPKATSNWARVDNNENRKIYMKGDIQIEELPTNDTNVKHVRISLPNGKIFKAAISGKIHGNFDSLFDQPTMKAILAGGLSDGKKYTVNYTQVLRANKGAPNKIVETKIQNMKIKDLTPVDTVNLVSDEEDEVEAVAERHIFTTEFGKYTTNVDQETFNQHQKKFTQKCEVKVFRHRLEVNAIKPNLKSSPSVKSSVLTRNQNKALPNSTITTNNILEVDSSVKDVYKDMTPVDTPTDMQETSSFNAMTPAESTLLTKQSEQSANTSTIPADDPYNKDDLDLPPVYLDNTVKSTPAQGTSVLSRSLSPVNTSILSQQQTNLDADTANTSKLLPQIDSHLKDDDIVLMNCTNEQTSTPSQKQTSSTSDVAKATEVIDIDDSSNDSVVENITSNTDSNKNADAVSEALAKVLLENLSVKPAMETEINIVIPPVIQSVTAVTNLKTALLQDLGIVPSVAPVIDIDDSDEDEIQIPTVKQTSSIIKECVVKLLKCDNLVKKYELMRAMKRCYVLLERLNNSMLETATEASSNVDIINNKTTEERKQDTDEDFIQFDVEETFGSPQLSRCPSLSILDNWDDENQPSPTSPYPSSPVMEVYDAIVQLCNKHNDESDLVNEPENSYSTHTCDSEWSLTKFGYRTQELLLSTLTPTTERGESEILLTSCDDITINEEEKLVTTSIAPKLLTIAIKFLEENPDLIYQMESMRKTRRMLVNTPTNTLKRKTDTSFEDSIANKISKLGTLALNALNSCLKTVGASRISYNYNKGDGTNVNDSEKKFAILEFKPNSIHDFDQINVTEDRNMTATVEESKPPKAVAHLDPLPLYEYNNGLEANEITLKLTELNENSLVSVSSDQHIDTHSSTGDCSMTHKIDDKKISNVTELCNIENKKSENIEGDRKGHNDRNISVLDTEDQDYSLNDMTATVEKKENAKKSEDSITLSDIEINIPEKNSMEQETHTVANNTHVNAGEYDMTTTVEDKPLIDELPAHYEHINVKGSETSLIGIQYHNDSETFCKEKHEETSIFEVNNIYDNCQVINNSVTYNDTETRNDVETEESAIRLLASEATDFKNMSNAFYKTGQSDKEQLPAIGPEFHTFASNETGPEGTEIDIKLNQDDVVYNTVITSPELNENQSEENIPTSVKVSIRSEQVTSDSSNFAASNITIDDQLDEIPIDDLSNEGYEVEVVVSHGEDNIDIVGSLCVRSPEAAPVNESQLKSPVFIDSKEILFNYHDYSKQPKQKENTINLREERIFDEINSERLDPEASSEVAVKVTESNLEVTPKDDPDPENPSVNHSQECIIYQQNSECLDTEGCERADVKTGESSIKVAPKSDSAPENTSINHGQESVTNHRNSGRSDTEGSAQVVVKTTESSLEVAPKEDSVPDSQLVNHSNECVINQCKSESLNTEGFAAADVTTAELSLEVAPKDDPVPENISINHSQQCVTNLLNSERLDREESAEAGVETAEPSLEVAAKDYPVAENTSINLSHECVTKLLNSERLDKESSSEASVNTTSSLEVVLKDDPVPANTLVNQNEEKNIKEFCHVKPKPECKYELYQEDDWLTVITTENDKEETEASPVFLSPNDVFEDTVVVASVSSKNAIIKGYEYDDVYVFPLSESGSNTSNDSIGQELNEDISVVSAIGKDNLHDINFGVIEPVHTYNRKCLKRKISMRDVKIPEKKYRKCKNIDCVKQTVTSMIESAYSREYKRLLEYCSSIKFSYSRPFHKECLDVEDLISKWPIRGACADVPNDVAEEHLFVDLEEEDRFQPDPATQSLAEEISYEYEKTDAVLETPSSEADGANFNMGFGEGSGRVIQNLKTGGESNISAATLSDVKQSQPVFKSVDLDDYNNLDSTKDDLVFKIRKHFNFIQLRDRVRSFFKKSRVELKLDWIQQNIKDTADLKGRFNDKYHAEVFPFDLCSSEYMKPIPTEAVVQVVQVGQLPVSAAAQNPVTCDPRVTQVSDASPSQCSVDNSPNDDSQSDIKTEYTELTTADLSLPLQEYAQQNHAMNLASHENNIELIEQTISLEMEIKAEESPEIKEELPDIQEEKSNSSDTELRRLNNATPENMNHAYKNNEDKSEENNVIYETPEQNDSETFSQQRQQNGTSEKTDQIAHAMNAAGITTTPETVTNTRAHALVNILSQKMRHGSVNTTQTTTNTYSKATSINAMALQQALAQILPPPLNQTGSCENNQTQSTSVGPQVLHIVQGKNASGNQITLVDNSQQSVISAPNATQVLHIVQNKSAAAGQTSNGTLTPHNNSFSGLSLVDAGLQQGGNQLLHIVNTGNQKTGSPGQLLKRVNLLTNLANVQGSNEQKMVQFVCKSADGKAIQLNAPHQRSMVLRLQPIETPAPKSTESQEPSPTGSASNKESASAQEIKSRSIYEENYAKFIQNSSSKTPGLEKSTSLPKFNQAFGKPVFQEGSQKQGETANNNSHLPAGSTNTENAEVQATDNAINLEHIVPIGSPPLLIRKPTPTTSQSQSNIVQQIKQTIAPMNIQTMHGGVIYTRQIPVNIGGGQTINLITVPSTELINDETAKTQTSQGDIEPSIIKIVPQGQSTNNSETSQEDNNNHAGSSSENTPTPQPQPVLTQMRIKLPMLSKAPQMVQGARVVRPSFFQIQRNVIGGANQPVYQQLVLTAAPPLGQQTIRLPQAQASRPIKVPSESQASSSESHMSSSTLEQLREFDMVLEQVKERSTVQPAGNSNNNSFKIHTSSSDTTDGNGSSNCSTESAPQVLYTIGNNQSLNVAYVNRKTTVTTPTTSTYVRSPDSSGIADSPTSSTHVNIPHTVTTDSSPTEMSSASKQAKVGSKSKSRPKSTSNPPNTLKLNSSVPPKTSSQKPLEDEQTTQRILYILAEYKEQVENSPDKDKPAPRRRSNPPSNPGSSKRKKSSSSRRSGTRDMSPVHGEDTCRTMGSEDSSCGTSQGDCNESCLDSHSPQDSPRKVARKITFDQELNVTQPRPQPQRNVIVADGQTITVARGTTGKPATAVLMPANYILPVSMVKGGQQIAIVTNRGPKLLTVGGEGGATNALLLQRLIGPAGLKPVLARPGVRHVRLPTAALHNLQAFNLATATTVQPPDSTASPTPGPTPPELVDTRATSSPWTDRDSHDVKPERGSSPEGSEPWNLPSSADPHEYSYEETVRTDNMDRTVLDPIPDRYSPDMEAQRIFDKMFDVDSKKSYAVDSPRYDIDPSECDDKAYQVVQKKDGSHRQHRISHVSAAALRHKYAILEHELRLQKSLSEECEDLGVDSPSASELFPEAELLFAASPAHEHNQDPHHSHTPQPIQSSIPQPDMDDQIATDHLIPREIDVSQCLGDVGIVAVSEDGMQATIALDQEEFARSHPNTTFHSEPTEGEVQPFTITGLKGRHITSTIFHSNSAPATVLMAAPQATVISQAPDHSVKYEIENMISQMPSTHNNDINLSSVLVKDDGLTRFDSILTDSRELHLTNTASAIVHSSGNATQVIRRVCYEDDKRERDARFLIDEPDNVIAGDDAKMVAEDSSRDATLESMADVDDDRSSPERHAELFWESNSASERSEGRRPLDFSSDSDKCCKSPSFDETNSTDSSGVGTHMRLDSVIKEARGRERSGSADGSSADDTHPPLRTYPPKRMYHPLEGEAERSLSGKTRAGERSPDSLEVRRRASGRGVVKRGCHCCNGSPAPPRPKKPRQRKPTLDFNTNN